MSTATVPHVVLVPRPEQGHINPFTSLAQFLAESGICVTLVHSTHTRSLLPSSPSHNAHQHGSIRIETMPHFLSAPDGSSDMSFKNVAASVPIMRKGLEDLLHKLMQEENAPCCLISDPLFPWCHDVALKFGLPRVELLPCCAAIVAIGSNIPELVARGYLPAIDDESKAKMIDFLPGLSPLRVADLPIALVGKELQSPPFQFFSSAFVHLKSAVRVLMNTVYEVDRNVLEALRTEQNLCIDAVGPLFMISPNRSIGSSLLQEDNSCLAWLDQQRESSVLYISFGSLLVIEENALEELAHGVEASGERFLWVIRPDERKGKLIQEILPQGFMERTADRGLVVSWAPQLAVLGHRSVSAFLTHCGWNSVLESLSNGIPLLGFPLMADQPYQPFQLKLLVHDWRVGLPLLPADAPNVERSHVKAAVAAMMKGVEGAEVRKRAAEWRDAAHKACAHAGTSQSYLQKFVDDLKTGQLKILPTHK